MPKVLIVTPNGLDEPGGIARQMRYLMNAFALTRPEISVSAAAARPSRSRYLSHLSTVLGFARILWTCIADDVDVVHINMASKGSTFRKLIMLYACKLVGCGVVIHLHGSGFRDFFGRLPNFAAAWVARGFRAADAVVFLDESWRPYALEQFGVQADKIYIIENGVPLPTALATPANEVSNIVFVGEVGERKGVDVLVAALEKVHRQGHAFSACIIGGGQTHPYSSPVLQNSGKLTFAGPLGQEEVWQALVKSDLFVLPSRRENQPVAILEAMAHRLPIVSTAVSGVPRLVEHGTTGLLVEPGNVDELVAALIHLISSPEQRISMGRAGRERVERRYSISLAAAAFSDLYVKVCGR